VNSVANTMQLLENVSVDVERGTSVEVFSITSNNDSMPECVGMDYHPMIDANASVSDDDVDDVDDLLCDSSDKCHTSSESDIDDQQHSEKSPLRAVQLAQWAVRNNITDTALGEILSLLKPHHPNLPLDTRTLKKTPTTNDIKQVMGLDGKVGHYSYLGIQCGLVDLLQQQHLSEETSLVLQFNMDGLPVYKSSSVELWPLLCLVRQLSHKPFVVGLYCGSKKPASLSDYLQDFVQELNSLLVEGISYGSMKYNVEIGCFVCDAPARAFVKNVKSHTAYYGCEKCTQKGLHIAYKMTFPKTDAKLRTDKEFSLMSDEAHHHGLSPLSLLPVGLVTSFVLDYMHLVCLGVCRRLVTFWLRGPIQRDISKASRLGAAAVQQLSSKLVNLRHSIPAEFARKPRCLTEIDRWKATEFRQFLLYTGPVVLFDVLPDAVYNHFLLLSVAIILLVSPKFCGPYADYAHSLLCLFVEQAKHIYGEDFIVYNVHGLTHLAADVKRHGCLDLFSAFAYENKLQDLKRRVRKGSCPLPQIIRRY